MSQLRVPVGPHDHRRGPDAAALVIVEYGDFQCGYCGDAYYELERLREMLGDRLQIVFRHFALTDAHPFALAAAEASEASAAQGDFWAMHDMLFQNQDALDDESLLAYADALQLDLDRFALDLAEHRYVGHIRNDFLSGVRSGVNGTPNLFLNGERYQGPNTAEAILAAVRGGVEAAF